MCIRDSIPGDLALFLVKQQDGGEGLPGAVFRLGLQGVSLLRVGLSGVDLVVGLQGSDLPLSLIHISPVAGRTPSPASTSPRPARLSAVTLREHMRT